MLNLKLYLMKKFKARYLSAFMAAIAGIGVAYADIDVKGTVTDSAGEPIIGASVLEKSTLKGTATDIDGNFKITVPDNATLRFSAVGYGDKEAKAEPVMRIVLTESSDMLEDLVVIGYGTQKKSVVTAAISSINSDDLEMTAPVRVDNALKGLASGVTVTSSSGQPGAAARVRIRGVGTINNVDSTILILPTSHLLRC